MNRLSEMRPHIADALAQCGGNLTETWDSESPSGALTGRIEQDWLLLRIECAARFPTGALRSERLQQWLTWNRQLQGGAKLALSASTRSRKAVALAELPLDEGEDGPVSLRIEQACIGLRQASALVTGSPAPEQNGPLSASPADGVVRQEHLLTILQATGWPVSQRESGLVVQLDVPDAFCQALVEPVAQNAVRLCVDLPCDPKQSETSRLATTWFLLAGCSVVRMARAVFLGPPGDAFGWEVLLGANLSVDELQRGLEALSVACRISLREVEALQDEPVAQEFLGIRGLRSAGVNRNEAPLYSQTASEDV